MNEFSVGDVVGVEPDFSNDGFEPFVGTVVEIDGPNDENPILYVRDPDGNVEPWMLGNVRKR